MIISCPKCSARFMIDEKVLLPNGRLVRCTKCKNSWREMVSDDAPKGAENQPSDKSKTNVEQASPPEGSSSALENTSKGSENLDEKEEGLDLAINKKRPKSRQNARNKNLPALQKQQKPDKSGWIILISFLTLITCAFLLLPSKVVEYWPSSAELYKKINIDPSARDNDSETKETIPVSSYLLIKHLKGQPTLQNGVNILTISGEIHNLTDKEQKTVPILISLLGEKKRPLRKWQIKPSAKVIPPKEFVFFSSSLPNPPINTRDIRTNFVDEDTDKTAH